MSATNNQKKIEEIKKSPEKVNTGPRSSAQSKNFRSNSFLSLCLKRTLKGKQIKIKKIS